MKYDRLTEKDIDICTWDSPKPKVKIKPMPLLTIDGNVYNPQEQANIRLKHLEDLIEQGKLIELPCIMRSLDAELAVRMREMREVEHNDRD